MPPRSIVEAFQEVVATDPDKVAYRFKREGRWVDLSWKAHAESVARIAKSLMAAGVGAGDRVAILSDTRLEWAQCDLGILSCGGVTVGIYPSHPGPDCAYVVDHSESGVLFVENAAQLDKVLAVREEIGSVRLIVLIEGAAPPVAGVLDWADFLRRGEHVRDAQLAERARAIGMQDLAALVYTSGTTGMPKGVMLSHGNVLFATDSASRSLQLAPHYVTLLFLPLAHVFARLVLYYSMRARAVVAYAEDLSTIAENLREVQPHFIASVPRIYEKFHERITSGVERASPGRRRIFAWALAAGTRASRLRQAGRRPSAWLALQLALARRLVFGKIHAIMGGRLIYGVSGGAPLDPSIAEFFDACAIPLLQGYGMTENASFTHVNLLEHNKLGTVGRAGHGVEVRIAEDGEILTRGPNVMRGYYKDAEATALAIDPEGWLHTGDIGEIDTEGFLRITDRKKDLIVTAGGKKVAPQKIEHLLQSSRYIHQALVYGDRRKYISALVTLQAEAVQEWAQARGVEAASTAALAADPRVLELVRAEIEEQNRQLASFESVKKFRILPHDFTVATGELTPTLKVRRKLVVEKYQELLEEMYAG
jgi:long-chain acyl-CoA synthetase